MELSTLDHPENNMEKPTKLFNKNYLLLWQSQFISSLGTQAFSMAMILWIWNTTGSATMMGLLQMFASIPAIILGPIGGAFADRFSRRRIIILSDLFRSIAVLSTTALLFLIPENTNILLAAIFITAVFNTTVYSFFGPAISASIPELVPKDRVPGANSLTQFSQQFSLIVGQGLGGTLFRLLGAPLLFLIDGITFLYAAICESFVKIPQHIPDTSGSVREEFRKFRKDILYGFKYINGVPGLRTTVLISALLTFFTAPLVLLLPVFVDNFLKVPIDWYGFIVAAFGVGILIGSILAGTIRLPPATRGRVLVFILIVQAIGYGLFGLVRNPYLATGVGFVDGVFNGFFFVMFTSILQLSTPSDIRGRVFGILATLSGILTPVALGLAGVVADLIDKNIPVIYFTSGIIMTVIIVIVSFNADFRGYLSQNFEENRDDQELETVSAQ